MKVLVALMLLANALIAQHGGFSGGYPAEEAGEVRLWAAGLSVAIPAEAFV
jgi:hypothetical protein